MPVQLISFAVNNFTPRSWTPTQNKNLDIGKFWKCKAHVGRANKYRKRDYLHLTVGFDWKQISNDYVAFFWCEHRPSEIEGSSRKSINVITIIEWVIGKENTFPYLKVRIFFSIEGKGPGTAGELRKPVEMTDHRNGEKTVKRRPFSFQVKANTEETDQSKRP